MTKRQKHTRRHVNNRNSVRKNMINWAYTTISWKANGDCMFCGVCTQSHLYELCRFFSLSKYAVAMIACNLTAIVHQCIFCEKNSVSIDSPKNVKLTSFSTSLGCIENQNIDKMK